VLITALFYKVTKLNELVLAVVDRAVQRLFSGQRAPKRQMC
tara:strand:- start:999 stop:1121 length:123 start_codon:yes stop_codon:yes gene_type:complete